MLRENRNRRENRRQIWEIQDRKHIRTVNRDFIKNKKIKKMNFSSPSSRLVLKINQNADYNSKYRDLVPLTRPFCSVQMPFYLPPSPSKKKTTHPEQKLKTVFLPFRVCSTILRLSYFCKRNKQNAIDLSK